MEDETAAEDNLNKPIIIIPNPPSVPPIPPTILQDIRAAAVTAEENQDQEQEQEEEELAVFAKAAAASALGHDMEEEEEEEEEIAVRLPHIDPSPSPPGAHAAAASPDVMLSPPPPPQDDDDDNDFVDEIFVSAEAPVLDAVSPPPPDPGPVPPGNDAQTTTAGGGEPPAPPVDMEGKDNDHDDFGDFATSVVATVLPSTPFSSTPPLSARDPPEPSTTTSAAGKESQMDDSAGGGRVEETDFDDDDDDFGDFASVPAAVTAAAVTAPAPQEPVIEERQQQIASLSPVLVPTAKAANPPAVPPIVDAKAFFEAGFGGTNVSPTHAASSAARIRKVLAELQHVNLTQSLGLGRRFEAKVSAWPGDILTKTLQVGLMRGEGQGHHHQEEEGEEEENHVISIAWALASPGPSRFNSISQAPVPAPTEEEEEVEEDEEEIENAAMQTEKATSFSSSHPSLVVPKDISLESLPSELDLDFLAGGGSADSDSGGGGGERGVIRLETGENQGNIAFFGLGLGPPAGKDETKTGTIAPLVGTQQEKEEKEGVDAATTIVPNRGPLSAEAEAVLSGVNLPNFGFMLAKIPVVPSLTNYTTRRPQAVALPPPQQSVKEGNEEREDNIGV